MFSPLLFTRGLPNKKGAPLKFDHKRRGVGTRLKVGLRSDRANNLKTGLKRVPTRVHDGANMAPEGSLFVPEWLLSLALHPAVTLQSCLVLYPRRMKTPF